MHFALRVVQSGGSSPSAGFELPVVREREFLTDSAHFVAVPNVPGSRSMLRIYNVDPERPASVRVRIFDDRENPLSDATIELNGPNVTTSYVGTSFELRPKTAEVPLSQLLPAGPDPVILTVTPLAPGARFWAFITVTDNVTQQVTIVLPH